MTATEAIAVVAERTGFTVAEILSHRRTRPLAWARHLSWYVLREGFDMSYPEIARAFDYDHSSVMHGIRRVAAQVESQPKLAESLDELITQVRPELSSLEPPRPLLGRLR